MHSILEQTMTPDLIIVDSWMKGIFPQKQYEMLNYGIVSLSQIVLNSEW